MIIEVKHEGRLIPWHQIDIGDCFVARDDNYIAMKLSPDEFVIVGRSHGRRYSVNEYNSLDNTRLVTKLIAEPDND